MKGEERMSRTKTMGDTEKTVLVGALILGAWLGIDALVQRAEARDLKRTEEDDAVPRTAAERRVRLVRSRRPRRAA